MHDQLNGMSDKFKKVLDGVAVRGRGNPVDHQRLIQAFSWFYDQGERPAPSAVMIYLETKGAKRDVSAWADTLWDTVVNLLDFRRGDQEHLFDPHIL
jgi:hypothetical protein